MKNVKMQGSQSRGGLSELVLPKPNCLTICTCLGFLPMILLIKVIFIFLAMISLP